MTKILLLFENKAFSESALQALSTIEKQFELKQFEANDFFNNHSSKVDNSILFIDNAAVNVFGDHLRRMMLNNLIVYVYHENEALNNAHESHSVSDGYLSENSNANDIYAFLSIKGRMIQSNENGNPLTLVSQKLYLSSQISTDSMLSQKGFGAYWKDRDGKYIACNKKFAEDFEIEDITSRTDLNLLNDKKSGILFNKYERNVSDQNQSKLNFDIEIKMNNGTKEWLRMSKHPICDYSGQCQGFFGTYEIVTQQKEIELKLQTNESLLDILMSSFPEAMFFKDADSRYVKVNKTQANLLNIDTPEAAIGKTDFDFYPIEYAREAFAAEQRILFSGVAIKDNIECYQNNETTSWLSVSKVPILNEKDEVVGIVGFARDITSLKESEALLEHEQDLLRILMENIPSNIYFKDIDSKFTRINSTKARAHGLKSPDEAIGKTDFDFFPEEKAQSSFDDERAIIETGIPVINKVEKVENQEKWVSTSKLPVKAINGEIEGTVGISVDITDQIMAQRNLEYAKEKAEEANIAKSQFLANMSHEIRTPMNGVIGMADILRRTELSMEQKEYIDIIIKSGNNLLSILNDILDFSKIESGKMELESIPISVRKVVEEVADILVIKANDKELNLATYIDTNIPDTVAGDSIRLRQIILNLANNALKFTQEGEVVIYANYKGLVNNQHKVLFEVVDTGIGLSEEGISKLFSSFSQADTSTTRKFGGTGLGLAISKKLVEQMHGNIGVESEEGKGSKFYFSVYFDQCDTEVAQESQVVASFSDLNVLIVDDNKTNRLIFKSYLDYWNCPYQEATNGIEGYDMLKKANDEGKPYDIALVDFQMAELDGIGMGMRVTEDQVSPDTKLILISSVSDALRLSEMKEKGFSSYLHKPIKFEQLYGAILRTLANNSEAFIEAQDVEMVDSYVPEHDAIAKPQQESTTGSGDKRILIAEDNPINAKIAKLTLKPIAHTIDHAVNGQEAVDLFKANGYDYIFMDVQMPKLNGYEATVKIREFEEATEAENRTPVIAMTANTMEEDMEYCLQIGMDAFLSKPFKTHEVTKIIAELQQ